jgi:hypothetical protein
MVAAGCGDDLARTLACEWNTLVLHMDSQGIVNIQVTLTENASVKITAKESPNH